MHHKHKCKTILENIREDYWNLEFGEKFLDLTLKAHSIKGKFIKLGFNEIFYSVKKMEEQASERKKIFANHIFDRRLISRIYKQR